MDLFQGLARGQKTSAHVAHAFCDHRTLDLPQPGFPDPSTLVCSRLGIVGGFPFRVSNSRSVSVQVPALRNMQSNPGQFSFASRSSSRQFLLGLPGSSRALGRWQLMPVYIVHPRPRFLSLGFCLCRKSFTQHPAIHSRQERTLHHTLEHRESSSSISIPTHKLTFDFRYISPKALPLISFQHSHPSRNGQVCLLLVFFFFTLPPTLFRAVFVSKWLFPPSSETGSVPASALFVHFRAALTECSGQEYGSGLPQEAEMPRSVLLASLYLLDAHIIYRIHSCFIQPGPPILQFKEVSIRRLYIIYIRTV